MKCNRYITIRIQTRFPKSIYWQDYCEYFIIHSLNYKFMKSIQIKIEQEIYKIVQSPPTINLYQVFHPKGKFEMTRRYSGEWKVLMQNKRWDSIPLLHIGKAIEEKLGIVTYN